jgi:hypothetical protein
MSGPVAPRVFHPKISAIAGLSDMSVNQCQEMVDSRVGEHARLFLVNGVERCDPALSARRNFQNVATDVAISDFRSILRRLHLGLSY